MSQKHKKSKTKPLEISMKKEEEEISEKSEYVKGLAALSST